MNLTKRFLEEVDKLDKVELSHLYILLFAMDADEIRRGKAMNYVWRTLKDKEKSDQ